MTDEERCATCGKEAMTRCDQCGAALCRSHRTLIETELGSWSRCSSCSLRNNSARARS
jgi:hypothetical protein